MPRPPQSPPQPRPLPHSSHIQPYTSPSTETLLPVASELLLMLFPSPKRTPFPFPEGPALSARSPPAFKALAFNDTSSRKAARSVPGCGLQDLDLNASSATQ